MGSPGRLRIWIIAIILFGRANTGIALAIPAPASLTAMDAGPTPRNLRFLAVRAEDTVTTGGMFDSLPAADLSSDDFESGSGLVPIREVLQAMMNQTTSSASPSGSVSLNAVPSPSLSVASSSGQLSASITSTAISPLASPPKQGPGIVLLSSTVLPGFSTTGQSPAPTSTSNSGNNNAENDNGGVVSSHKVLILGSIIGGVLCVTLFLFFILDPTIFAKFCGFFGWRTLKPGKKDRGISHIAEPSFMVERGSPERTFGSTNASRYSPTCSPEKSARDEKAPVQTDHIVSKFSICSSDYLTASPRESAVSSISTISNSTRDSVDFPPKRSTVTFARVARPPRPPRPPTADSPMLSDSVYLACLNQPYVIVAPSPLNNVDTVDPPPKKMLTASEFFAFHVPDIISSLVGNTNSGGGKRERARATLATAHQQPSTSGKAQSESLHSRTKSAPLLGSLRSVMTRAAKTSTIAPSDDSGNVGDASGDVASGDIAQRVTNHRRSRSASGWAYPDRPRLRKTFMN